ncbi:MAG: ribbon-helix-helix protein, CopG family [Oryzomonas sp.]|nr:ribbon-helix-helix protein, CopG family [Oryzomonas sp.]MDR3581231.1 ribbon-helix-helix protein, CopG family [Oryzomonas sp.]
MKPQIIATRVSDELLERIDKVAAHLGQTRKDIVKKAFEEWLKCDVGSC